MQQVFYALSDLPSPISVSLLLHYVDIPKFIDLFPDEEPLSCLQYGAIMINAAMNIYVMVFCGHKFSIHLDNQACGFSAI